MDPWTYEQREHEAQERFERREREAEDESLAASIHWHPEVSCGAFECVNGCDGAPDFCDAARAFLSKATGEQP
jgi:hypothetical protein